MDKRTVVIEVREEVYLDLMIQAKQDEEKVKQLIEDDINFIYAAYRKAKQESIADV